MTTDNGFPAVSKFREIINQVPEVDRAMVALSANRYLNCVGGQRPSDAARSTVRDYLADPERFRQHFEKVRREEREGNKHHVY